MKPFTVISKTKTKCDYCRIAIDDDSYLECEKCKQSVHIKCLPHSSTPGDLLGDVFFDFTCRKCVGKEDAGTETPKERFVRQRIPWMLVLTLAIHNLSIKSKGLSHHGFFHWRTHIISFVDKNWNYLFGPRVRRRKQWIGSVSGALSINSPEYFQSGVSVGLEHGWWRLAKLNSTPRSVRVKYEQRIQERLQLRTDKREVVVPDENSCDSDLSVTDHPIGDQAQEKPSEYLQTRSHQSFSEGCARVIPYMGRPRKVFNIKDEKPPQPEHQQQQLKHEDTLDEVSPSNQPLSTVQASLMDFLAESLGGDDLSMFMPPPLIGTVGKGDFFMSDALLETPGHSANLFELEPNFGLPPVETDTVNIKTESLTEVQPKQEDMLLGSSDSEEYEEQEDETMSTEEDKKYLPRIVQVTNYQAQEEQVPQVKEEPVETKEEVEEIEIETFENSKLNLERCKPSGFVRQPRRNLPWLQETKQEPLQQETKQEPLQQETKQEPLQQETKQKPLKQETKQEPLKQETKQEPLTQETNQEPLQKETDLDEAQDQQLRQMSASEEQTLLQYLQQVFRLEETTPMDIPAHVRRFYRKLCIRQWKREHNRLIFNLDEHIDPTASARLQLNKQQAQVLDRFHLLEQGNPNTRSSFYARIVGNTEYEMFMSPYTRRILHPFIYRNETMAPPWLRLMCEMQHRVNKCHPSRSSIDFCYVRPQHIPAVNALLQSTFWPGIDVSECLSYPDYSVVALYKKLVVGCGFLVPDVGYNEAYISFMAVRPNWQRTGMGSFMLYHLIQTCMSKDITLHVSANSAAVLLYQKFGFKMEEVIIDFYEKYLPPNSKQSHNAFFFRLMR